MKKKSIFLMIGALSSIPLIAGAVCLGVSSNKTKVVSYNGETVEAGIGFSNYNEIKINNKKIPSNNLFYYDSDDGLIIKEKVNWYGDIIDYYEFWSTDIMSDSIQNNRLINIENANELYKASMINQAILIVGAVLLGISILSIIICIPGYLFSKNKDKNN